MYFVKAIAIAIIRFSGRAGHASQYELNGSYGGFERHGKLEKVRRVDCEGFDFGTGWPKVEVTIGASMTHTWNAEITVMGRSKLR